MKIRGFITHKQAEQYIDCQDYFSVDAKKRKIAVSDGMTQSIFSAHWAKVLVHSYVHKEWNKQNDITELQNEWIEYVRKELLHQKDIGWPTWMIENALNMKQGAGATLCGICFNGYKWESLVIGDTSIVEVDEKNNIVKIHKSKGGGYDNHPDYLDSFEGIVGNIVSASGILKDFHKILLVSDPIAELLYYKQNEDMCPLLVNKMLSVNNHQNFCNLVDVLRKDEGMHNDDSTMIIIEHDGMEQFNLDSSMDNLDVLIENEARAQTKSIERYETTKLF